MVAGGRVRGESKEIQETGTRPQKAPTEDAPRSETSPRVDTAITSGANQHNDRSPGGYTLKGLVHTPKHGSWLNLIEAVFSKMARTFLRHIRVASKDELKERITRGIAEMNAAPVIYRWRNFDLAA